MSELGSSCCPEFLPIIVSLLKSHSTHRYHQMVNAEIRLIIFFAAKDGEALYSQQKTRPGADCGSDHELLITKLWLKLKEVGKPSRPFRCAAAAKSCQWCPTVCDPRDGSPPGSPVPGILQARILEWIAISFPNAWKWKGKVKSLSRVPLFVTPWTVAYQAPLSMGFSRQEYCSGLPFPSPVHESEKWKWSRSVVSDSQQPHGLQPTRLLHPWDSPGKSTGVGCHCLLR